jgi:hypothetical protein
MATEKTLHRSDLAPETLLLEIAWVTHRLDLRRTSKTDIRGRKQFFDALVHYQGILARGGKKTVTRQAIRLWEGGAVPRRLNANDFLHSFLLQFRASKGTDWDKQRTEEFERLDVFLRNTREPLEDLPSSRSNVPLPALDPHIALTMQGLIRFSNRSEQSEANAFFRGSRSNDEQDQSYYLVYRYSTNNGSVMKSFLVIQKPLREVRRIHVFNHFVWSGQEISYMSHIFRECEGFVLKLAKSFYFLGYDYTVPVDKRREPELYRRERVSSKWLPNGISVLSFEYDDILRYPGLFPGLTMTVAGMAQPVIARVAMLHVGTRQLLGRAISDYQVAPSELAFKDVPADLQSTIKNLQDLGCRRFGITLDEHIHQTENDEELGRALASQILLMIDNFPAWENKKPAKKRGSLAARGAIETFGQARPRD